MSWGWEWRPYVSVAERRAQARRYAQRLAKQGRTLHPVEIAGRTIAKTFWGKSWCENLERYSDFANRLPRGQRYVRNGSVIDLQIDAGRVTALVSGSEIYEIEINIAALPPAQWKAMQKDCAQSIDSLIDLLQGRFSQGVMERLTRPKEGLFPQPKEIEISCSCPDWATLCKHAAAALYGVGARLDTQPETLFLLRKVDHLELINQAVDSANLDVALGAADSGDLAGQDLSALFGIELDAAPAKPSRATKKPRKSAASQQRGPAKVSQQQEAPATAEAVKSAKSRRKSRPEKKKNASKEKAVAEKQASSGKKTAVKKTPAAKKSAVPKAAAKTASAKKAVRKAPARHRKSAKAKKKQA